MGMNMSRRAASVALAAVLVVGLGHSSGRSSAPMPKGPVCAVANDRPCSILNSQLVETP